jgi:hypothetical protein
MIREWLSRKGKIVNSMEIRRPSFRSAGTARISPAP